jgi:hypothetical protein
MSTESKSLKKKLQTISKVISKNKLQLQKAHVQCRLLEARALKASRKINRSNLRKTRAYGKKKSKRTKRRKSKRTKKRTKKRISKATRKR